MPRLSLAVTLLFSATIAASQANSASSLAARSIAAMTGNVAISNVILSGTVTWAAGTEVKTGTIEFQALGTSNSRVDLTLDSGTLSEIRHDRPGISRGQWIDAAGKSHDLALHNVCTDAVWFFPPLSSLAAGPTVTLFYVGLETRNSTAVQHLRSITNIATAYSPAFSATEFYLDASSLLPTAITFNTHPDNNQDANIPVEIDFANYQQMSGILVPTHIRKLFAGQVILVPRNSLLWIQRPFRHRSPYSH
jgi:hypothetical protein